MADEVEIKLEPDTVFTPLTQLVRQHYFGYLEKQLKENVRAWKTTKSNGTVESLSEEHIHSCAKILEDNAIKACMMAQIYQRSMVKIIATVRRNTQESRLENHLHEIICEQEKNPLPANEISETATKATQTGEVVSLKRIHSPKKKLLQNQENDCDEGTSLSLQQKIQMFQQRLNRENAAAVAAACVRNNASEKYGNEKRNEMRNSQRHKRKRYYANSYKRERLHSETPQSTLSVSRSPTPTQAPTTATPASSSTYPSEIVPQSDTINENHEEEDNIAKELAQIFCEEKTELDEIFGIDPLDEPDDPQISSILKEIKNAKMSTEIPEPAPVQASVSRISAEVSTTSPSFNVISSTPNVCMPTTAIKSEYNDLALVPAAASTSKQKNPEQTTTNDHSVALSKSLWPCELFMQRRRLTESLNRLIEEDFRWHELIKWKFATLFGEDSDDEFAACSPSIELDEVLLSSCIRRITPWMVKHLMKPMRDGLIGNRFLFKKLAKALARSIVNENQYPDERVIKRTIEEFFCMHQAVVSAEDLIDIPNISFN